MSTCTGAGLPQKEEYIVDDSERLSLCDIIIKMSARSQLTTVGSFEQY